MINSEGIPSSLTVLLLGPMQVLVQGQPLPRLRSRKALWLLALLVLRGGRPVEREWLAETLWPDVDPVRAASNLRVVLSELRQALSREGERLQSPSRHTLSFDLTGAAVDVQTFDAAVAGQDPSAVRQAVGLYRGALLEGCAEEWVPQERTVREQACLHALEVLAETAFAAEEYAAAANDYRRVIGMDPWREAAQRGLMQSLARSGDANAALSVYQAFIRLLRKDDPRAVPDELTTALYARLRANAKQRASVPSMITAVDTVTPVVTGYLPHPLTELVGREDEREEVAARLRRSRLVTLTGPGGIGKTRLALEVAAEAAPEFADGAWLAALDALSNEDQIVPQIAAVLGLREEAGRTPLEGLTDHLHTKRLLLVLDNCEHMLKTAAEVTAHLLKACAGLHILTTSREALGITGESAWAVPALSVPDLDRLPNGSASLVRVVNGYDAVRLFAERAQGVQKTFTLTGENARSVAHICVRLEGVPLAIELAAARTKVLTVEQIAVRLDDHLSLLTSGSRGSPGRHQTLRATLDWSYSLLGADEQALLARLSVFAGGWTLEAAEAICAGLDSESDVKAGQVDVKAGQVLDLLASLTDKSLVIFEVPEEVGRYRLLEMVRQYAAGRLEDGGSVEIRARHQDWFLAFAEKAIPHRRGAEQAAWLTSLEAEHGNLRRALDACEEDTPGTESGATSQNCLRLAAALWPFWASRSYFSEGRTYLHRALSRKDTQEATSTRGQALKGAAVLADRQGDYVTAWALYEQSLTLFRQMDDRKETGSALGSLNYLAQRLGDVAAALAFGAEAQAQYEQNLIVFEDLDDTQAVAYTRHFLGHLAANRGDFALAVIHHERSLRAFREAGDKNGIAFALGNLGGIACLQSDFAAARALNTESLRAFQEAGDKNGVASALGNLGEVAYRQGDYSVSVTHYQQSLRMYQEVGDKDGIALSLVNLGKIAYHQGDYVLSVTHCQQSLRLYQEMGNRKGMATAYHYLVPAVRNQGEHAAARALQTKQIHLCQELGDKVGLAEGLEGTAPILLAQGETLEAVRLWGAAEALRDSIGAPLPVNEQEAYEQQVEQARADLSESDFAAAWEEGRALSWEQAAEYALNEESRGI